jgi:N-acetylmuramoyl-L-alanine amidase
MKIFINPGHAPQGDPDPGACNADTGLRESDVAAAIAALVTHYLIKAGYEIKAVQSDDLASAVVGTANGWQADLFVSIHCNSAGNEAAQGVETWYCHHSAAGAKLATLIQGQLVNSLPLVDRGIKEATPGKDGLYVLTNTDMPACLVEMAFISNDADEKLLADQVRQDQFARAIARGITDYFA